MRNLLSIHAVEPGAALVGSLQLERRSARVNRWRSAQRGELPVTVARLVMLVARAVSVSSPLKAWASQRWGVAKVRRRRSVNAQGDCRCDVFYATGGKI